MNPLALCILSLAAQSPQDNEAAIREMAWQLHQQPPTAAELVDQWRLGDEELVLQAAGRGLAKQEALGPLLLAVLQRYKDASPPAALAELLPTVPYYAEAVPLLQDLRSQPQWQTAAAETLLRWGIYPAQAQHPLAADLMSQLQKGWQPDGPHCAAVLGLGEDYRAVLLPALIQRFDLSADDCKSLAGLSRQNWSAFDQHLLDSVLLNHQLLRKPTEQWVDAEQLLQQAWQLYLTDELALGQLQLIEQFLLQHRHLGTPVMLNEVWQTATSNRIAAAKAFLRHNPMAMAVPMMAAEAFDEGASVDHRVKTIQALFLAAPDAQIEALLPMLRPDQDRKIFRALLAGLRLRPMEMMPGSIEVLLPKLRTNDASLAMEVLILTADHQTRLDWLPKASALPAAVGKRVMQMAWGVDPQADVLEVFKEMSNQKHPARRDLGAAGLRAAMSEEDLAAHYQQLLMGAEDPKLFDEFLNKLRDMRSDAALEVIIDWLISPGGRSNPRSGPFASMLIEETAARRLFDAWWQQREGLTDFQMDWAACHLAPDLADARQRLHDRFFQVDPRTQTMFLSRMETGAGQQEVDLWNRLLLDHSYDETIRRISAHLLFRAAADADLQTAKAWVRPSLDALLQSNDAAFQQRPWLVLVRGLAGMKNVEWRKSLLQQVRELPAEYSQAFVRACYQGFADQPLDEQRQALQDAVLDQLLQPSFNAFPVNSRPQYQQVSDQYFEFFHRCLALQAHSPSIEVDQLFADQILQLGTASTADCLSLLAPALSNWPQAGAAAKTVLMATESRRSFRYPPSDDDAAQRPMSSYLVGTDFFAELRERYDRGELQNLSDACELAIHRWPRDRRCYLWQGWVALTESNLELATQAFEQGLDRSGWVEYVRMEPLLGLAVTEAMQNQDWDTLRAYIKQNDQTDALLTGRIVHGLLPQLENCLPASE